MANKKGAKHKKKVASRNSVVQNQNTNEVEDYRNKNVIIKTFQSGQENYKKYESLNGKKQFDANHELKQSGKNIYTAFELGLKHYLDKRIAELIENSIGDTGELENIKRGLEKKKYIAKDGRDQVVDTAHLTELMYRFADPNPISSGIDLDLIIRNTPYVNNQIKHNGKKVDLGRYKDSYKEIKKIILTYIDKDADIQGEMPSEFQSVRKAFDDWKSNLHFDYCLVVDQMEDLSEDDLKCISKLPWSLVFDFDSNSDESGLSHSFLLQSGDQPNYFTIRKPAVTDFDPVAKKPYWYMLSGVKDMPDTVPSNYMSWYQKYGMDLPLSIKKYHENFPKGLKVLVLGGDDDKLKDLLTNIAAIYENKYTVYFSVKGARYESIVKNKMFKLYHYPMSCSEFVSGIRQYSTLVGIENKSLGKTIPGKDGEVQINENDYAHFTILYQGIDEDSGKDQRNKEADRFYKGETELSWYGARNKFAVERTKLTQDLTKRIYSSLENVPYDRITLLHDPGAGGTTLSRQLAFNISNTMPVIVLTFYSENKTFRQIEKLYGLVRMSILIVIESIILNEETTKKLIVELQSHGIPHIILYVKRIGKKDKKNNYLSILTDHEFDQMTEKLKRYISNSAKVEKLESLRRDSSERYPFYLSLNTFEDNFKGINDYVMKFIKNCSPADSKILSYIALVDKYADKKIPVSFFSNVDEEDSVGIFRDNVNNALITIINNRDLKIRYSRFSDCIIEQEIQRRIGSNKENVYRADAFAHLIMEFIKYSHSNNLISYDSSVELLKNLLILRDSKSMIRSYFSPVITDIADLLRYEKGNEKYNSIGLIFKTLEETYPDEPHFKAHLSRFYTNLEKNYNKGIENAYDAVKISEEKGQNDPLLYHICAMSHYRYLEERLFEDAIVAHKYDYKSDYEEVIRKIKSELVAASEMFQNVRLTNNKIAGYISDIEMCISVIDFAKNITNCSTQEFIRKYKDSWVMEYYDRAINLMDGYRNIQSEEDDYLSLKLDDKYYSTIDDITQDIEKTIGMWSSYLEKAEEEEKPRVRRFIARARAKSFNSSNSQSDIKSILDLMEQNIAYEPENEANIRIWFNALRNYTVENSSKLLDEALSKLYSWKNMGESIEAYYYYFILICIKAIEGSSRHEAQIPDLLRSLRDKTEFMQNNNTIFEWLGRGKGVGRLFGAYRYDTTGRKRIKVSFDEIEEKGSYVEGRIDRVNSDRSAIIVSHGMEVFFTPSGPKGAKTPVTSEDVGKKVRFIAGFSYDGVRALNRSVEIISSSEEIIGLERYINKDLKCTISRIDYASSIIYVNLFDEPGVRGRIKASELEDNESIKDYNKDDVIWCHVIDVREGKYLELSKRDPQENMTDWQKKLHSINL